ncbi:von Willebrand factor-like protein, partial [Leptotrombidium deliense]
MQITTFLIVTFIVFINAQDDCPRNQVYDDCGSSCPVTCNNMKQKNKECDKKCKIGCRCKK